MQAGPSRFERLKPEDYPFPESVARRILSPALIVRVDQVRENLRRMLGYLGGKPDRWRPHLKTTKIPEIIDEYLRAGLRTFKCATTREAAQLIEAVRRQGIEEADLLVAYPLTGPALERVAGLARGEPSCRVAVVCEDPDAVASIPEPLGVFAELNPGMDRTGIAVSKTEEVRRLARCAGARFRGLHHYEGHIHGGDAADRRRQAFACYEKLVEQADVLDRSGIRIGEIVTSGTPTFLHALAFEPLGGLSDTIHRVSPGTVIYHDLCTERECEEIDLVPAAQIFTRVVSHPADRIATCDAGSKSIAAEAGDPCAFVLHHPELEPLTPSEEHLPLRVHSGNSPSRGAALLLIPQHVCPTVNLAEQAVLMDGPDLLGIATVRARAHDI